MRRLRSKRHTFLPKELILIIFNILASSDRESCLSLSLVSSWTRRIVLPHLLHTAIITERNCTAFTERVVNTQHASYVKRLCMGTESSRAGSILASCTSITTLITSPSFIKLLDDPTPFQSLTHLCIIHYSLSDTKFIKRLFPQLTHFAGTIYSDCEFVFHRALLRAYGAQLVMTVGLVSNAWHSKEWMGKARKVEKRMYLASYNMFGLMQDWSQGARDSVWDRARSETRSVLGLDASDNSS